MIDENVSHLIVDECEYDSLKQKQYDSKSMVTVVTVDTDEIREEN